MRLSEMDRHELSYALLRFAVGGVFLWFGIDKLIHPTAWLAWTPPWLLRVIPFQGTVFMGVQGAVETLVGVALIWGKFVRNAALLAVIILAIISSAVGVNEITVRDVGLLGAALALLTAADASAKRPIGRKNIALAATVYVLAIFVVGVLFLRS